MSGDSPEMWKVEVPLGEFYEAIVDAGRRAKYLAVLTALVRDADSATFYEDITRYWHSLHDVTGSDVLFVLAGPDAAGKLDDDGIPDDEQPVAYSSPGVAVTRSWERRLRPRLSGWAARVGTIDAPPRAELAHSQTLGISQLRRRLGVSENQLPCLHLAFIGYQFGHAPLILPLSARTVYDSVKGIVALFDDDFAKVRRLATHLEHLEGRKYKHSVRASQPYLNERELSPEQVEAAHAIILACSSAPSTPKEMATVRAECFRRLAVFKGVDVFRRLQSYIDVHLDLERAKAVEETAQAITLGTKELKDTWDAIFRRAGDLNTCEPINIKHRIFIAYQSSDRRYAQYLHTALERHVPTFLDVRCVRPGDRWVDVIQAALDAAELTVVLVGASARNSSSTWYHQSEYVRAIELARSGRQRIVPIYLNGSSGSIPYGLDGVQGIVTNWASGLRIEEVMKTAAQIAALLPSR